ncbi:hypothetical protein BRADI_2g14072v3 [Brachypodium distachyon]|uniref:Uncharacterized protein n=1 Tax=Brachypodium distachyon TaxID=15368 RepID=A0A2K2D8K2_BRADI|nr:hypothetical protein BRADI_2g14072v3 [Brachypodium distachyon]
MTRAAGALVGWHPWEHPHEQYGRNPAWILQGGPPGPTPPCRERGRPPTPQVIESRFRGHGAVQSGVSLGRTAGLAGAVPRLGSTWGKLGPNGTVDSSTPARPRYAP